MSVNKFGKDRSVDHRYLNVPIKYILHYYGANPDGKIKYEYPSYEEVLKKFNLIGVDEHFLTREVYEDLKNKGHFETKLVKKGTDKTLCVVDIFGRKFALVAWRNNDTCKMGMPRLCRIVFKNKKTYIDYKGKLILISDPSGWVF